MTTNLPPQNVAVLAAGAWGLVLASLLCEKGHRVTAWDLPTVIEKLLVNRRFEKIPDFKIPDSLSFTADLTNLLKGECKPDCVVVTVPSHAIRSLMQSIKKYYVSSSESPCWVLCTKGIEEESLMTMTEVVESVCGPEWKERLVVLSGPSLAAEVAVRQPTTICAASANSQLSDYVQQLFMNDYFRVYTQSDVMGVELGGAIKNVIAIAAGACDGLGFGDNPRAALITRGLAEMVRLGTAMGARPATFAGLSGMGDLIVTCSSRLSRNHQFGDLLAKGRTCEQALQEIGMVVEGMRTAHSTHELAKKHGVEMPITRQVYSVIYEGKSPRQAVQDLMQRGARPEMDQGR